MTEKHDLIPLLGSKSAVSEIMNGKREIYLIAARKLAGRFLIPAECFLNLDPVTV